MKLGTTEEELRACRKAFEDVKVGSWIWCSFYDMLLHVMQKPIEKKIGWIMLAYRDKAIRLRALRPVLNPDQLPKAELESLHFKEYPDSTWDGESIFGNCDTQTTDQ